MVQNLKSRLGVQSEEQHNWPPFDRLTPPHHPCREVRLVLLSQTRGLGGKVGSVHLEQAKKKSRLAQITGDNSDYCKMKSLTDRQTGKYYKGSEETHRTEQKPNDNWKRCLAVKTGVTRFSEGARLHNMKTPLTQMLIKHVKQDWFFCSVFVSHSLHSFLEIRLSVSRKCFQLKSSSIFHQLHPGTST